MKKLLFYLLGTLVFLLFLIGIAAVSAYNHTHAVENSALLDGILDFEAVSIKTDENDTQVYSQSISMTTDSNDTLFSNESNAEANDSSYVLNTSSNKIHRMDCSSVANIKTSNKLFTDDYAQAIEDGYSPCQICLSSQ